MVIRVVGFSRMGTKLERFLQKKNQHTPKGNIWILKTGVMGRCQKLDIILENKVIQKLKLEKNVFFTKKGLLNWYS